MQGTLRVLRLPGGGGGSAKAFMVRAGLFDDCDAVLHWHPSCENRPATSPARRGSPPSSGSAGTSAHAAGAPEAGRSALDAVELTNHAAELLREHTPDFTRIHHVITAGGKRPNVVPDFAEAFYYIRHPGPRSSVRSIHASSSAPRPGRWRPRPRSRPSTWAESSRSCPTTPSAREPEEPRIGSTTCSYDEAEKSFAAKIRETLEQPVPLESLSRVENPSGQVGKGSTDVGDVSWVVPTAGFTHRLLGTRNPGSLLAGRRSRRHEHRPQRNDPRHPRPRRHRE